MTKFGFSADFEPSRGNTRPGLVWLENSLKPTLWGAGLQLHCFFQNVTQGWNKPFVDDQSCSTSSLDSFPPNLTILTAYNAIQTSSDISELKLAFRLS
jgi:hypothetical protein